jgi:hypothetical protein
MGPSAKPVRKRTASMNASELANAVPPEKMPDNIMAGTSQIFFRPDLSEREVINREEMTKPYPVMETMCPVCALFRLKVFIKMGNSSAIAFLSNSTRPQVEANNTAIKF